MGTNGWAEFGTANGGHVYMKPLEPRMYAVADVDNNGRLPRNYRHIQWWGVPVNRNNIPDQTQLLTLRTAVSGAIKIHVSYGLALNRNALRDDAGPWRPQGVIHVTPDGLKEVAWTWWDNHLDGHPIIRIQAHGNRDADPWRYGDHFLLPTDHPELINNAIKRVTEHVAQG